MQDIFKYKFYCKIHKIIDIHNSIKQPYKKIKSLLHNHIAKNKKSNKRNPKE